MYSISVYLYDSICIRSLLCVKANKETWQTLHAEHPDTGPSAHGRPIVGSASTSQFRLSKLSETMHVLRDEVIPRTPENHTGNIKSCIHFLVSTVHEKKTIPTSWTSHYLPRFLWHPYVKSTMGHSPQPVSSSQDCNGCSLGPHNPTMILVVTGWMGGIFWNPPHQQNPPASSSIFRTLKEKWNRPYSMPVARHKRSTHRPRA